MSFINLTDAEIDPESPVDDTLLEKIQLALADLDARTTAIKTFPYEIRASGPLENYNPLYGKRKRIGGVTRLEAQTFTSCRLTLEVPGSSGTLEVDIRKNKRVDIPIVSMHRKFNSGITSIAQITPNLATQSITRSTSQIATQSITSWKAAINVQSIILLGSNLVRYNLASAPDADWKVGDTINAASCTAGGNNGHFTIVRINDDGFPSVIVTNASGVEQTGAVGTVTLDAWAFNFTNPVDTEFVAGEIALFGSHTSGPTNSSWTIYAVNSGGNNIIVKSSVIVAQGGAAGVVDVARMVYTFSSAAPSDLVVGESLLASGHTNAANDGGFTITAVNFGGNNVVVYNQNGVVQGGAAGLVNTKRWIIALASDPTSFFTVGEYVVIENTTSANNIQSTPVKQINRGGTNNLIIYNAPNTMVAQGGAAGSASHQYMKVNFAADQSLIFSTASQIELVGIVNTSNLGAYDVAGVNFGGGANYNVLITILNGGSEQNCPAGRVTIESRSIFSTRPSIVFPTTGETSYNNISLASTTSAVFNSEATVTDADIAAGVFLSLDLPQIPAGPASDLTFQLN